MNPADVATSEVRARAEVCGFLARVLHSHPTEDSVGALREVAAELGMAFPQDFSIAQLDQDYLDLFMVPNPRYVAPYESVFRDAWPVPGALRRGSNPAELGGTIKGLLMGESTLEVRGCYLQAGLLQEEDLPDHIGNELRFVAYLWAREGAAPPEPSGDLAELADAFCREHILTWIGQLRQRVMERERLGYYGLALRVAEEVLRDEESGEQAGSCAVAVPVGR
jgi:TorA maturation chaperone TorD